VREAPRSNRGRTQFREKILFGPYSCDMRLFWSWWVFLVFSCYSTPRLKRSIPSSLRFSLLLVQLLFCVSSGQDKLASDMSGMSALRCGQWITKEEVYTNRIHQAGSGKSFYVQHWRAVVVINICGRSEGHRMWYYNQRRSIHCSRAVRVSRHLISSILSAFNSFLRCFYRCLSNKQSEHCIITTTGRILYV